MNWIELQNGQLLKATREVMAFYETFDKQDGGERWIGHGFGPTISKGEIVMSLGHYSYQQDSTGYFGHVVYHAWKVLWNEKTVLLNPMIQKFEQLSFEGWKDFFMHSFNRVGLKGSNTQKNMVGLGHESPTSNSYQIPCGTS